MLASVLLILVAGREVGDATTEALVRTLGEVLGARALVRGFDQPPDEESVDRLGQSVGATAAVVVSWAGPDQASLQISVGAGKERHDRRLAFLPADPPAERGRALGFVVASILLPPSRLAELSVRQAAPPPPPPAPPPAPSPPRWALEAFGEAAMAIEGHGPGLGVGVAGRWAATPHWGLRLGLTARSGTVDVAQASSLELGLAAGLYRSLYISPRGLFSLHVRAEGIALYQELTHFSSDDPRPVRRGRLVPAAAQLAELSFQLAPAVTLRAGIGVEEVLGTTSVIVHRERVTDLAPWRMVAELGVSARF